MSISVVQYAQGITFSGSVTAHNSVIMVITQFGDNTGGALTTSNPTFAGSAVTGAVKVASKNSTASANAVATDTWLLPNLAGGSANVGATVSGTAYNVDIFEISGLGPNPQLDAGGGTSAGNGSGVIGSSGSCPALQDSPVLLIGSAIQFAVTLTGPATAWTNEATASFNATGYQIITSAGGTYSYTATSGGSSNPWAATIVALTPQPGVTMGMEQSPAVATGSLSATFGTGVTAGDSIIAVAACQTSNAAALSIGSPLLGGTPFPGAVQLLTTQSASTDAVCAAWWLLPDIPAGFAGQKIVSFTATATGGTQTAVGLVAWETFGLGAAPVLDRRIAQQGSASAASTVGTLAMDGAAGLAFAAAASYQSALTDPASPWTAPVHTSNQFLTAAWQNVNGGDTPSMSAGTAAGDWAAGVVAVTPALTTAQAWRDFTATNPSTFNNLTTWSMNSVINGLPGSGQTIQVLVPDSPAPGYQRSILLALNAGPFDFSGITLIHNLGLQNTYNATVITPSMSTAPCYADNPVSPQVQFETFLLELAAWAKATYGTAGTAVYLVGFSKSAFGAHTLIFRNPAVFGKAAGWDFPAMITDINGDDATAGTTWSDGTSNFLANYGTDANYQKYRLSSANIAAWAAASDFGAEKRIWTGGYFMFGADVQAFFGVETGAGVRHDEFYSLDVSHDWHADWLQPALQALYGAPASGYIVSRTAGPALTSRVHPPF